MSTQSRWAAAAEQATILEPAQPRPAEALAQPSAWLLWNLALTILLSAFLLFQVQPLISKFILPWFGGSPAVWTTCMLFFQCLLFCGYAYAHLTSRLLSGRGQALLHLGLIVAAVILLPITPGRRLEAEARHGADLADSGAAGGFRRAAVFRALGHGPFGASVVQPGLCAAVALPALCALQFRLARGAADVSCAVRAGICGRRAGLAVVGIVRRLRLALCCGGGMDLALSGRSADGRDVEAAASDDRSPSAGNSPTIGRRILWLALPAAASLMLLATTSQACQNVAVVPLLWIVPLALYLLTFIICFDHERWYRRGTYCAIAAALVFLSAGGADWLSDVIPKLIPAIDAKTFGLNFVQERALYFATMFMVCMVCHGELVRLRPSAVHLTEYYLMIAAGGAIGGAFVSLVAPHIFPGYWEWNLGLAISFLVVAIYLLKSSAIGLSRSTGTQSGVGSERRWPVLAMRSK